MTPSSWRTWLAAGWAAAALAHAAAAADSPFVAAIARARRWVVRIRAETPAARLTHRAGEPDQSLRVILPSLLHHDPAEVLRQAEQALAAWKALQCEVSCDYADAAISDVVKGVARQAGLPAVVLPGAAQARITFVCEGIPAYSALARACDSGRLDFRLRGGVVVASAADTLAPDEMYADVASCYELKSRLDALSKPCSVSLDRATASEAAAALSERAGLRLALTPAARRIGKRVSLDAEGTPAREVMRLTLAALGLRVALCKDGFLAYAPDDPERPGAAASVAFGAGIVFDSDGYIVTAASTVAGRPKITVRLPDGARASARVVGVSAERGVAVIRVERRGLEEAVFGDSDALKPGEFVVVVSFPFDSPRPAATMGIVAGVDQRVSRRYSSAILTDAAVLPGSAGGALLNADGQVVGMAVAAFDRSSLGCCLPAGRVLDAATALKYGLPLAQNRLGLIVRSVMPDMVSELKLKQAKGARVIAVDAGGPAARAGLRPDDVIVACGDAEIADAAALAQVVTSAGPGSALRLAVWRRGELRAAKVVLEQASK